MITITIETKDGTFIAKTNNPEIAEMELDRLVREYFTREDCGLADECEEECLVDKLNEYPPEFEKDMDEWDERCCDDIEKRRECQRKVINKYLKNK
jgi:hypothetical protein